MTKNEALKILDELKNSSSMVKHGLAVGFAMAALYEYFKEKSLPAGRQDKNPEMTREDWQIVGILHDADYEIAGKSLEKHTDETVKKLQERGVDQQVIDAIRGHCDKAERTTLMAKSVYAVDELTGFIVACALVQPDKKLSSVTVESVLRKFKDKSFARGVNRDQIKTCESKLEIPLEEFINLTLKSMQDHSGELGL